MTCIRSARTFRVWTPFRSLRNRLIAHSSHLASNPEKHSVKEIGTEEPDLLAMRFQFPEAWIIRRTERLEAKPNQGLRDDQH